MKMNIFFEITDNVDWRHQETRTKWESKNRALYDEGGGDREMMTTIVRTGYDQLITIPISRNNKIHLRLSRTALQPWDTGKLARGTHPIGEIGASGGLVWCNVRWELRSLSASETSDVVNSTAVGVRPEKGPRSPHTHTHKHHSPLD